MTPELRQYLKDQVLVFRRKYRNCTWQQILTFCKEGDQGGFNLNYIKPDSLKKFLLYQMKKFDEEGNMKRRAGSGGTNKLPREKVEDIKTNIANKKWPSTRKTASETQVRSQNKRKNVSKWKLNVSFITISYMRCL